MSLGMAQVPSAVNNVSATLFESLPITPIAYSLVFQMLQDGDDISMRETSFPLKSGGNWETMHITIKRANGETIEVTFVRDDYSDAVYSLESIDTF